MILCTYVSYYLRTAKESIIFFFRILLFCHFSVVRILSPPVIFDLGDRPLVAVEGDGLHDEVEGLLLGLATKAVSKVNKAKRNPVTSLTFRLFSEMNHVAEEACTFGPSRFCTERSLKTDEKPEQR